MEFRDHQTLGFEVRGCFRVQGLLYLGLQGSGFRVTMA